MSICGCIYARISSSLKLPVSSLNVRSFINYCFIKHSIFVIKSIFKLIFYQVFLLNSFSSLLAWKKNLLFVVVIENCSTVRN